MSGEFNRALVEARLGVPIEDALDGVAGAWTARTSPGWSWRSASSARSAATWPRCSPRVAATLRERERLRRQVQVLSAEGRLSAWILVGLPLLLIVYLVLVRPEYISPLVTEPLGWIMMSVVGVVLLVVGVVLAAQGRQGGGVR